jgi:hypothetical protein
MFKIIKFIVEHVYIYARFYVLICIFGIPCSFAKNAVFYYEPSDAVLEGTIVTKKVNGHCSLLNYADDEFAIHEICPFLVLDKPIDVKAYPGYSLAPTPKRDKPEKNVKILQIEDFEHEDFNYKNGDHIRIRGALFHNFKNNDHTRVLINFWQCKKLKL